MPEEEKRGAVAATRLKDASMDSGRDTKQKPVEKKIGKQGKNMLKTSGRRIGDPQPLEELRAKEEAETNRKVHESLDNFIRQTIRCEPYMTFTGRPGDKPLQRLRPDVFENHVAGKFTRGFKVEGGSDGRDIGTDDSMGIDFHLSDSDGLKDNSTNTAMKGIGALGRGSQHSLKVPGVVAFTQAAAKTDLPGWPLLSPSKVPMQKCDKCIREFCSSLNYRRHIRVHRKSLNPEKEDLSKERSKIAAFWDKLTPGEASSIVSYENMEIEDLSGELAVKALTSFVQQPPGMPSMPQVILKAGAALLDVVQNKTSIFPLPSERLLSILEDSSERTFLCGGTSVSVQRFVFNGEAGKVGLEERNLVASMGFHIEQRLVKAWMVDKETEALRCQQALFKEEEAAQQKRAKILEKKRMKKIRQKERKGGASQLVLQGMEIESFDDESTIPGIGEEDDSPTATGSTSSSLAYVQDLNLPESSDMDVVETIAHVDAKDEGVASELGEESAVDHIKVRLDNPQGHQNDKVTSPLGQDFRNPMHLEVAETLVSISQDEGYGKEFVVDKPEQKKLSVRDDEAGGDVDLEVGVSQSSHNRGGRGEGQYGPHGRRIDQERLVSDYKRREPDRKVARVGRERGRADVPEAYQKAGRGYEGRFVDGPSPFKVVRKSNSYSVKSDSGISEVSSFSRPQLYRSKPSNMNRTVSAIGNGQVVWTRKVPQPVVEPKKEDEGTQDEESASKSVASDGQAVKEKDVLPRTLADLPVIPNVGKPEDVEEKTEDLPSSVQLEVDSAPQMPLRTGSVSFRLDVNSQDWPSLPHRAETNPGWCGPSLSKTTSLESVSNGLDEGTLLSHSEYGSFELVSGDIQLAADLTARDVLLGTDTGSEDHGAEEQEDSILSGALLVGSLSVPLGKFVVDSVFQSRPRSSVASAPHLYGDSSDSSKMDYSAYPEEATKQEQSHDSSLSGNSLLSSSTKNLDMPSDSVGHGRGSLTRSHSGSAQGSKTKGSFSMTSPERDGASRHIAAPAIGHERNATKQGSWPNPAGRYVTVKVWRAVGMVGDRHDSGISGSMGPGPESTVTYDGKSIEEDGSVEREGSIGGLSKSEGSRDLMDEDASEGVEHDDSSVVSNPEDDSRAFNQSGADDCNSEIKADNTSGLELEEAVEGQDLATVCSLSTFVEAAGRFLNERWKLAVATASVEDILAVPAEWKEPSQESARCHFLEMVLDQLSARQQAGLPLPSSTVEGQSSEKTAKDGAFLSRSLTDTEYRSLEDRRYQLGVDDQRLDETGAQESGAHQAISSEDDAATRDASSSPVDSEHYMSGSETSRNYTAPSAPANNRGYGWDKRPESRGEGSSHARMGSGRQERWYRNPRDRFPEQRYMPRPRAPLDKS